MRIGIGNDHAGYDLKLAIAAHLASRGHEVVDYGHHGTDRADYPVYGRIVAEAVAAGEVEGGVVICGTGVGISIAANKVRGIRCACVSEPFSALLSRQHNNSNMVAFGARVVGEDLAKMIVDCWTDGEFQGGRHADRVGLITAIEDEQGR